MAHTATTSERTARRFDRRATRIDRVEEASEEALPTDDARPGLAAGDGRPSEGEVVRRCGRFALIRDRGGLRWVLTSRAGSVWHWHAEGRRWSAACPGYASEEEATAGLEETLAHEQAGDLDEQHTAPRTGHGPRSP